MNFGERLRRAFYLNDIAATERACMAADGFDDVIRQPGRSIVGYPVGTFRELPQTPYDVDQQVDSALDRIFTEASAEGLGSNDTPGPEAPRDMRGASIDAGAAALYEMRNTMQLGSTGEFPPDFNAPEKPVNPSDPADLDWKGEGE